MGNRVFWRALAVALLVIGAATIIGVGSYDAGVAHGIASSGAVTAAPPPGAQYVYVWPRPWGFGFFPFFPVLFFLFLFVALRALLWRGRGRWRAGTGCRYGGAPPAGTT